MKFIVSKTARFVAWCLAIVITLLSLVPLGMRPQTGAPRNLEHIAIFAATGVAFGLGYSRRPSFVAVALVFFAGAIELAQTFVPGRHARLSDFIVDAVTMGAAAAVASIAATNILKHRV